MKKLITKKHLRAEVAANRKNENRESVESKSIKITERVISLVSFSESPSIMCYMDFKNEVMTRYIIRHCFEHGKRVILPLVDKTDGLMKIVPYEIMDEERDVIPGTLGILEPNRDKVKSINPKEIDVVIVPGVAFDLNKNRLGFGAGLYDKFLSSVNDGCTKIGIAFEFQIYDTIPVEEHDISLDFIITEERII